jgi:hypothetical protein
MNRMKFCPNSLHFTLAIGNYLLTVRSVALHLAGGSTAAVLLQWRNLTGTIHKSSNDGKG